MERERWKIRACVLAAVFCAIIIGIIYYLQYIRPAELTEGVLISIMGEVGDGLHDGSAE